MKRLILAALLIAPPAWAKPRPVSGERTEQLRCVAALAIVANEQERGVGDWDDVPPLKERGADFSDFVSQAVVKDSGRTPDEVRTLILKQVEALQVRAMKSSDPETLARGIVDRCLAMMDRLLPPPPKPGLLQCAVVVTLAYEEVKGREGMSKTAKDLATIGAVLESRARDELRAAGKTESEGDIVIGLERERQLALYQANAASGAGDRIDFPACFDLAKPSQKVGH